ncbi:Glucan endo-1,3-alpha-glucosidase agn1 [Ascochyta rabiei]|uniref:Glucan endo-1,3-alpha-glucosidase agn1 n=1 Tax=Didymella rabiei TaxID=5454 RepID=UPI0021FB808D|nr:Glucan endo-1,3-alpha-glucosidase agn1 [Ascochyta rabiei]UPX10408.1 Glucan endo-1,3-alpha-glucosidase agn1 [Ascochyta rabiei]
MRNVMISAICIGLLACYAEANAVFAHFMVGNTAHYTQGTWETEMSLAQGSRIDAFALNVAAAESMNEDQIGFAFKAAQARGFKLLFSFDCAGGREGGWTPAEVLALLRTYGTQGASSTTTCL